MSQLQLNAVHSVRYGPQPGILVVNVTGVDYRGDSFTADYYYSPQDPHGLAPLIGQWLADHPNVVIGEYVPIEVTENDVNNERERRISEGVIISNVTNDDILVTGRDKDKINLTNLKMIADFRIATNSSETILFRDGMNVDHSLTPQQFIQVWAISIQYVSDMYQLSWALKAMNPIPQNYTDNSFWDPASLEA